jgi:ribosomal protein S18 acetylase RimI-like enzyme
MHPRGMRLRVAPCTSLDDVAAIEATLPTGASAFHRMRYERQDGSEYLVARVDDVAVGHVLVTPESKYEGVRTALGTFPEANALGVAEAYQRQGVARALMAAAVDAAGRMGAHRLGLAVEPGNEAASRLYAALGFDRHRLEVVDVWHGIDDDGVRHEQRDLCSYWTRAVGSSG